MSGNGGTAVTLSPPHLLTSSPYHGRDTAVHATATTMRVGLTAVLDEGWLAFDTVKVTSLSDHITTRPGQLHDLAAQVRGALNGAGGGRLFVQYSNGTIGYEWRNAGVFNGSQNVSGSFTTPTGISSFQVGTEVVLDKGHLAFSSVILRAWSDPIAVTAGDGYQFDGQVAGSLVAPVGQGGQIVARYSNAAGGDAGYDVLWDNPANFNGTAQVQQTFNANPGAITMRLMLITNLDAGHLTYSNFGLQHMVTGFSTIQRTTYSVAGQSVAVKVAGDPVSGNNGIVFPYSDHLGSTSAMRHPNGSVTQTKYLPFGGYRGGSGGNPITDRGYTGHKHNDSLGLIYMNARYYVVGISRFASADSIIPNPTNPQSYNRYSYVLNRPLGLVDPTGHRECGAYDGCSGEALPPLPPPPRKPPKLSDVLDPVPLIFEGLPIQGATWANGFGANSYAEAFPGKYTARSAGLHPGMDFGKPYNPDCASCNYVYSTVAGTISLVQFTGDADPNVVIDVGNGLYVIYGDVWIDSELLKAVIAAGEDGFQVNPGDFIGSLVDQREYNSDGSLKRDNTHVHLVVRQEQRIYNPAYFFKDPQVLARFTWGYASGEDLYSISSYVYGTNLNFWDAPTTVDLTRN